MSGLVEMLNHVAPPVLAALWRASWQGGLALTLVGGLVRLRPRMAPSVQCWLWRLAYLKLLIALVWGAPPDPGYFTAPTDFAHHAVGENLYSGFHR